MEELEPITSNLDLWGLPDVLNWLWSAATGCRGLFLVALLGLVSHARAQQNFFNVPSSEITPKGRFFGQEQVNVARDEQQSSTTMDFGLGRGMEVGLNCVGLTIVDGKGTHPTVTNPFILLNAQKRVDLSERTRIALGVQYGLTTTRKTTDGGSVYCNFIFHDVDRGFRFVAGPYYASKSYFGEGSRLFNDLVGLQAGFEQAVVRDRFVVQTDFISGEHDLGEVVPGMAYFITPTWILSAGYQIPTFGSTSIRSLVFEITYSPKG